MTFIRKNHLRFLSFLACSLAAVSPAQQPGINIEALKFESNSVSTALSNAEKTSLAGHLATIGDMNSLPDSIRKKAEAISKKLGQAGDVNKESDPVELSGKIRDLARKHAETERDFAAVLFDLALNLHPDDVDLAYDLEVLKIRHGVNPNWEEVIGAKLASFQPKRTQNAPGMTAASAPGITGKTDGIGRTQSLVKGLLVQQLEGSQFAGSASQMNATAIKSSKNSGDWRIRFNQPVGPMMSGALKRVQKFLDDKHDGVPQGFLVEISFEEQYVPKDGPSAAIACTLLLESLISDIDLDPGFAVTGDMSAKGEVGPVGGIDGKIRGAAKRNCTVIAIPAGNSGVVSDLLLLEGPSSLAKIQIFRIETFDQAQNLAFAAEARPEKLQEAITEFQQIQKALNRANGTTILKNQQVQAKLRKIVQLAPNHLSARLLLLKAVGREPRQLTLSGSLTAIDRAAAPLIRALRDDKFEAGSSLDNNEYRDAVSGLRRVRSQLDNRTHQCADAIIAYSTYIDTWVNKRPNSRNKQIELIEKIKASGSRVGSEFEKLHNRPDVKEELGDSE
ncbi:MAG: hypothetical protein HKN23_20170 [Verrucomicrobiales bacterium]|nr:hypothetical protein [Verrucomicrobiales bacterium]